MQVTRTYIGEPGRYYPDLGVTPEKGDEVTFGSVDQVPDDGRWKVPAKKSAAAKRAAKKTGGAPSEPDAAAASAEPTEES